MHTLETALITLINAYMMVLFVSVILSWFPNKSGLLLDLSTALETLTAPLLDAIRRFMPQTGMIDFSPIIAFILLNFLVYIIRAIL